jgi:hypothetical protein
MVDINLFEDSENEQPAKGDESFDELDNTGGLNLDENFGESLGVDDLNHDRDRDSGLKTGLKKPGEESLDDALGFNEDISQNQESGGDSLMDDDIPDLEEDEVSNDDGDYDFGSSKGKRISPVFLLIIGLLAAFVFIMFLKPNLIPLSIFQSRKPAATSAKTGVKSSKNRVQPGTKGAQKSGVQPGAASDTGAVKSSPVQSGISNNSVTMVDMSIKILADLSTQGQFGAVILEKDRFTAEYAAGTPGSSDAFGKRLQKLTGVAAVSTSPEDRLTANSKTVYLGVISGRFNQKNMPINGKAFLNEDEFQKIIKSKIQEQGLYLDSFKKRSSLSVSSQQQLNYEIVTEGEKEKTTAFLNQLKALSGGWQLQKLRIAPSDLDDYTAKKVKTVLDITILSQQQTKPAV